nr:winged helix-turn-helix domain-containing protein [Rhizobium sp. ACO-34A]
MKNQTTGSDEVLFGPFRLIPGQRLLMEGDVPLAVGSRALDILLVLIGRAGTIVTKRDIIDAVWPDTFVVEANISVHVAALRRVLRDGKEGARYIVNMPGRGYRFIAPVSHGGTAKNSSLPLPRPSAIGLPHQLTRLLGRSEALKQIGLRMRQGRLVTLVGSAGIGKTSCALAYAHSLADSHGDEEAAFVDLSPIDDGDLIPTAIASVLRLDLTREVSLASLIEQLQGQRLLLLIDNCEHLIEAAANAIVVLLRSLPDLRVLATSREPLRVDGEQSYRLEALPVPPPDVTTIRDALAFPAAELFIERAAAHLSDFEVGDADASTVARICADLDGIPLAIEFAAARLDAFPLAGLAGLIGQHMRLAGGERRGAPLRHRTILNALDWSYDLLDPTEQRLLRSLSVFSGGFTAEASAKVVGADDPVAHAEALAGLVLKSLVVIEPGDDARFRLLEIVRSHGLAKLQENEEFDRTRLAHAEFFAAALLEAKLRLPAETFVAQFAIEIDNIRTGLAWTLDTPARRQLAAHLAASAAPLLFGMSLLAECRRWMAAVLQVYDPDEDPTSERLQVQAALAASIYFTEGLTDETFQTWLRTLEFAEKIGDLPQIFSSLVALWTFQIRDPDYCEARRLAVRHASLAKAHHDVDARVMSDWMLGTTLHHIGDLAGACDHFDRFLDSETDAQRLAFVLLTGFDRRSASRAIRANARWMQGALSEGLDGAITAATEARMLEKALPLCEALIWQGTTLFLAGEYHQALILAEEVSERASAYFLDSHSGFAFSLKGMCRARAGAFEEGMRDIDRGLMLLGKARYKPFHPLILSERARMLAAVSQRQAALDTLAPLATLTRDTIGWCGSAYHLCRAELMAHDDHAAEAAFREGLELARLQTSLFWEMRLLLRHGEWHRSRGRMEAAVECWTKGLAASPRGKTFADGRQIARLIEEHGSISVNRLRLVEPASADGPAIPENHRIKE